MSKRCECGCSGEANVTITVKKDEHTTLKYNVNEQCFLGFMESKSYCTFEEAMKDFMEKK